MARSILDTGQKPSRLWRRGMVSGLSHEARLYVVGDILLQGQSGLFDQLVLSQDEECPEDREAGEEDMMWEHYIQGADEASCIGSCIQGHRACIVHPHLHKVYKEKMKMNCSRVEYYRSQLEKAEAEEMKRARYGDNDDYESGTILVIERVFPESYTPDKVYTYVSIKSGNKWFTTQGIGEAKSRTWDELWNFCMKDAIAVYCVTEIEEL